MNKLLNSIKNAILSFKKRMDYAFDQDRGEYMLELRRSSEAPASSSLLQMLPAIVFTALTILVVRMHAYQRPMSQFFWTTETDDSNITDFFSYNKMIVIVCCGVLVLLILIFNATTEALKIRRNIIYVPMCIYCLWIFFSYMASDYKEFALWGWNDRFEGTIPLICYMLLLFYIINTVKSEQNIKMVLYPLAGSTFILSLLGLSQAADKDFFRTEFGQKLIVPNWTLSSGQTTWQTIEEATAKGELYLQFTFNNREIYQTVYNINYVSFYLTLLIPVFGMLFIYECRKENGNLGKKMMLAILFSLIIFNFIGSASSGGVIGLAVIGLIGIVVLNKQLKKILKPLIVLFIITGLIMGFTFDRWKSEFGGIFSMFKADDSKTEAEGAAPSLSSDPAVETPDEENSKAGSAAYDLTLAGQTKPTIDYFDTTGNTLTVSLNGNPLIISIDQGGGNIIVTDENGERINLVVMSSDYPYYGFADDRFYDYITMAVTDDGTDSYIVFNTGGDSEQAWYFKLTEEGILNYNQLKRLVALHKVNSFGFENHRGFGSGRGGIWANSNPLLAKYFFVGAGADCYCAVYPQNDYAGKFNDGGSLNLIVDKPHNMYLMIGIGTGGISLIAVIAMYGIYLVQSFKTYWKREFEPDYMTYVGFGIFCGVAGFMFTGLVDDSTVSTMPMFYGLMGLGIAINMMIRSKDRQKALEAEE